MPSRPKRVALALPLGVPTMERITRGIMEHAAGRAGGWQLVFSPEAVALPLAALRPQEIDGVIAFAATRVEEKRLAALGVPAVNLSGALPAPRIPIVTTDNRSVGRLAAAHLLARGFRRFAYYGVGDVWYGRERGAGFADAVRAAGFSCSVCHARSGLDRGRPWLIDLRQLRRWLGRLRAPVGLLAVHDYRGRAVLDACAALGLRVPDDVAVVGVDDDVVACELATPTLTSVAPPGVEIGRRAAETLDELMSGRAASGRSTLIPATEIVARRSTDVLAVEDTTVAEAARLVNDRIAERLNVAQIAAEVSVSRRQLERRFRAALGLTPLEYVSRARVERAKRLLLDRSSLALKDVAAACGFTDSRRMNAVFRRIEKTSARSFRRRRP